MGYKDNGPAYSLQEAEKRRISLVPLDRQEQKYFGRSPVEAQVLKQCGCMPMKSLIRQIFESVSSRVVTETQDAGLRKFLMEKLRWP
jgi:hypothetical protein